jgi:hypothetical protein
VLAAGLVASAVAQQPSTVAIVGGTVHPVSGPPIEKATVLIRDGLIEAIGPDVAVPAGATRIEAAGRWITPGLFNVVSVVGLVEVPLGGGATDDRAIGSNNIAAAFRPWEAFDTATPLIAAARNDGITTIGLMPAGNLVSGQHALVDLAAGRLDTMHRAPRARRGRLRAQRIVRLLVRQRLLGRSHRDRSLRRPAQESPHPDGVHLMRRTLKILSALLAYPTAELQTAVPEMRAALAK